MRRPQNVPFVVGSPAGAARQQRRSGCSVPVTGGVAAQVPVGLVGRGSAALTGVSPEDDVKVLFVSAYRTDLNS